MADLTLSKKKLKKHRKEKNEEIEIVFENKAELSEDDVFISHKNNISNSKALKHDRKKKNKDKEDVESIDNTPAKKRKLLSTSQKESSDEGAMNQDNAISIHAVSPNKSKSSDSNSMPGQGVNWKEWKKKRKEEHKNWKEEKMIKSQEKLQKSLENKSPKEVEVNSISKGCDYTISIAVPGSILDNAQSPELKTYLAGQIARAASVFNVNEIIVYSESDMEDLKDTEESLKLHKKHHGCQQLLRILQYLECPQYLRKFYFPIHKDLQYAGLLNPLDIPHHLRASDYSEYREGVIVDMPLKQKKGSFVNIGLKMNAVIDKILETNVRVTVKLDQDQNSKKHYTGKAVSPTEPYKKCGIYWGYNVRLASSLNCVFTESPFKSGYDLTVGTSERGQSIDDIELPSFKHLLVVFGGLKGIEGGFEGDESIRVEEPSQLFNLYLNTCPHQGSRTIRTEEAILITMTALRPQISRLCQS